MPYFIVATQDGDETDYKPPKEASSPEQAVDLRGVIPECHDKVRVFPIKEKQTGDCMFWDKEDMDL